MTDNTYVYTALLHDGAGWSEAYGYLGSYYRKFDSARRELRWLLRTYPEKYSAWAIERIALDDGFVVRDERCVVLAHSKDAPIWDGSDSRPPPPAAPESETRP